jgi:hypothetical protein
MISYHGSYDKEGHKFANGGKDWNYYKDGEDCKDTKTVECYDKECGDKYEGMWTLSSLLLAIDCNAIPENTYYGPFFCGKAWTFEKCSSMWGYHSKASYDNGECKPWSDKVTYHGSVKQEGKEWMKWAYSCKESSWKYVKYDDKDCHSAASKCVKGMWLTLSNTR